MKDFSLLYGPARTWAVIVGTALVAVTIALFVQGSADAQQACQANGPTLEAAEQAYAASCSDPLAECEATDGGWACSSQEFGGDTVAQRSSSQDSVNNDSLADVDADGQDDDGLSSAEAWSKAPQSAADIPFVSLQPSPEPITEAGEGLVSANTSTTVRPQAPQSPGTAADPVPSPEPDEAESPDSPSEDVVNTSTAPPQDDDDDDSSPCQGAGQTKDDAIASYRENCSGKRQGCAEQQDGRWICTNGPVADIRVG